MDHFGSARAVSAAGLSDLETVSGISKNLLNKSTIGFIVGTNILNQQVFSYAKLNINVVETLANK